MIYGFTAENYLGDSIKFTLSENEPAHGLIVKEITGLGPGKAFINTNDYATDDGGQFNSSRMDKRTITITFKIVGNYNEIHDAVEYSRQLTYKYFPIKRRVHLIFDQMGHRTVDIYGYVESNEPNIFSKDEEETISILCDDPYFYQYGLGALQTTRFSAIDSLFEFPFENDSLDERLIELSSYAVKKERVITYEGDIEVGMKMTIHFLSSNIGDIIIYNLISGETMTIRIDRLNAIIGSPVTVNDELIISTEYKNHYVTFERGGISKNAINCIDRDSTWFKLHKGDNSFLYAINGGFEENIYFVIENKVVYEGI